MDGDDEAICCRAPGTCAFDKALRAHVGSCGLARRHAEADGDRLLCADTAALAECGVLLALLRERAAFALRLPSGPVIHAQALKLQCGGVRGLRSALEGGTDDVHRLVGQAQERWGSLHDLPWPALVREVVAWQPRRRTRGRPPDTRR